MKRLHIHLHTNDLEKSVAFYSALLGEQPAKQEADYAKWVLDDPAAHISLSTHCDDETGIAHAGISIETREELEAIAERMSAVAALTPEEGANCCYATSNKYWALDPQGAIWELFQTYGHSESFGSPAPALPEPASEGACCG